MEAIVANALYLFWSKTTEELNTVALTADSILFNHLVNQLELLNRLSILLASIVATSIFVESFLC